MKTSIATTLLTWQLWHSWCLIRQYKASHLVGIGTFQQAGGAQVEMLRKNTLTSDHLSDLRVKPRPSGR